MANNTPETPDHFRRLMEQSPVSIQIHDLGGRLFQWNEAYAKLYALNDDALAVLREKYNVRIDAQAETLGLAPYIERVYRGEDVVFPPYEYDGIDTLKTLGSKYPISRRCWVQTRGFPLRDEKGNITSAVFMSEDITELTHTKDSEKHFQALIKQSPLAIEIHSVDGRFVESNPAYSRISGLHGAELQAVKENYNLRQDKQLLQLGYGPLLERLYAGDTVEFPVHDYSVSMEASGIGIGVTDTGSIWLRSVGFPLKNNAGQTEFVVLMTEDITERKQAEENLEHLRAYNDHLIETASVMIVNLDAQGRVIHFNPAAETITGYTLAEVEGKDWFELLVPRERYPEVHEEFDRLVEGGIPQVFENPIVTKSGEERYISWRNSEIIKRGAIDGVTSFGIDITERREVQKALMESEAKFRQMLEQSPLSIQILNRTGYLEDVNQAWMELWGVKEEELDTIKASWCILEDEQLTSLGLMPLVEGAFRGERVLLPDIEYDAVPVFDDAGLPVVGANKRWVRGHLYPVLDANGEIKNVVDVEEDITEQKQAEEALLSYQDRLRALASEITLTEEQERKRIATALHDGAAQSLAFARIQLASAKKTVGDAEAARKLDDLSLLLKESLQQIRDVLLDLSSPALNEIGLAAALSEWLEEQIGRRHGLRISFDDHSGIVPLSDNVVAVLFRNARELLTNVIKNAKAAKVSVLMETSGEMLRIIIEDDGVGFDPEAVARRPSNDGAFGLFSIRERMTDLGGVLEIESAPGKGCKATLVAPYEKGNAVTTDQ